MEHPLHPDANAILARLKRERIYAFYHFTNVENLPGICQMQALCSKKMLEDQGRWPPPVPGGEGPSHELDRRNGNWDKVPLNLTPHTPMAYRKKGKQHFCFFVIPLEVAAWSSVVFTDSNAARTTSQLRDEGLSGLSNIKFEAIRSTPRPWERDGWHKFVQAEVLVPDNIPLKYMSKIAFVSKASMMHTERLCASLSHPQFSVDELLFADSPHALKGAISFPYVVELALTDMKVDKNMLYFSHLHKNKYSKRTHEHIKLVALVRAITGTRAKVLLHSRNMSRTLEHIIKTSEFETLNQYIRQYNIPLEALPVGAYSVEYYLDDICWASAEFEVVQ
jgi:hypothetical protein